MPGERQIEEIHWSRSRAGLDWMWEWDKKYFERKAVVFIRGPDGGYCTVADIKAELATREHVLNKPEAKALRKEQAKRGRNRGKRDR